MKQDKCNLNDIFCIPVDDLPGTESDTIMIYAPLSDCALLADASFANNLEAYAQKYIFPKETYAEAEPTETNIELKEVWEILTDYIPLSQREGNISSLNDFRNLSVLPNNKCNFSCSYCYSAKGRSHSELSIEKLKVAIDLFIRHDSHPKLTLSIFGGGEPMLSWKVITEGIDYARLRAENMKKELLVNITTNGSIINQSAIAFIKKQQVTMLITFEILEDIQNLQRGHYELVAKNLRALIDNGITPTLNSVITPANVERMEEMVNTVMTLWPELRYICLSPIIDKETFATVESLKKFHSLYIEHFFKAKKLGAQYGLKVDCTTQISLDCTLERYCPGEFGLTAQGLLSICPCISSPEEDRFDDYIYGGISDTLSIDIDEDKFQSLLGESLYSHPSCSPCFAKYNCAGGCMHKNHILSSAYRTEVCNYTREFIRRGLLERLLKQSDKS